ncbi:T9SS type A sorting domain-containing protein [Flammeovirga sp. SJP92]|uniref:T9SS type A sorting domain-containing protein n=1 Tax=Flammeovirga sp. SJP92 TaxID=1775430 RepID=UPI00155F8EE4|nr:T9SS type A sorting domain-containing protein [Flammeovirga sp. SJP92]
MKRNKLLKIGWFAYLFLFAGVLNLLHAQNQTCETAIKSYLGDNSATGTPNWFTFNVPKDMDRLILSTLGYTNRDTRVYVYRQCGTSYIAQNDDANGTLQTYLNLDVSRYQGETIYIRWELYSGIGGVFDWNLAGIDDQGRDYKANEVDINDFSIWYGEKLKIKNRFETRNTIQFSIVGNDNRVITIDGDSVEALSLAGSQEVMGSIYDDNGELIHQKTFTVTTLVDPTGKKRPSLEGFPIAFLGDPGDKIEIEGATNSTAELTYTFLSGGQNANVYEDTLSLNENLVFSDSILLQVSVSETEEYARRSIEIPVYIYINNVPFQQFMALEAFYKKNNGKNWANRSNWLSKSKSVGTWSGVTTESRVDILGNDYYTVTKIQFSNNKINGDLATEFKYLSDLNKIYFSSCNVKGLPASLSNLSNLKELYFYDNSGITSSLGVVNDLTTLETIVFSGCELTKFPEELLKLSELQFIDLSNNQIQKIPSGISSLTKLSNLHLDGNRFTFYPSIVNEITSLEVLDLSNNLISSIPSEIGNLSNLVELRLEKNSLLTIPSAFGNLTQLSTLDLGYTDISELPAELSNCTNLRYLYIEHCQFEHLPSVIEELPNLYNFYFDNNNLSFEDLIHQSTILNDINGIDYSPQRTYDLVMIQDPDKGTTTLSNSDVSEGNIYTWYRNNVEINGATSSSYTYNYDENINANFRCEIRNSDWPNLSLYSNSFNERGELVTLIVENIPSDTPEGNRIYTVGGLTNNSKGNRSYPLELNESTMKYELVLPKSLGAFEYYFTLRQYNEFSEVDNSGELFKRTIDLSTITGQLTIDDILAWNHVPALPNVCEESIEAIADSTYLVETSSMWYRFKADTRMKMTIRLSDSRVGTRFKIYDDCGGELILSSSRSSNWSLYGTVELERDQEVYIKLEDYNSIGDYAFKFNISTEQLYTYIVKSIPRNTPEGAKINAVGTFNDYEGDGYPLLKNEETGFYELILSERLGEHEFNFELNGLEAFSEVDGRGQFISRNVDTNNDTRSLEPIIAWNTIPSPENTCDTALEITEDGDYLKGMGDNWYTFTAIEDMELTFDVYDNSQLYKVFLYDVCGGNVIDYAYDYDGALEYNIAKGETILIKWADHYDGDDNSFEWTLTSKVTKTLIVKNIPNNIRWLTEIYAVGDMNNHNYRNTSYRLNYIGGEADHYEITFDADLDTINFSFAIGRTDSLREVNAEGEKFVRTIDLKTIPTNTEIDDIISWGNLPFFASNACDQAYVITDSILVNDTNNNVWYNFEADQDLVVTLSSKELTSLYTNVKVYDECGGNLLYYDEEITWREPQSHLNFRMEEGEAVKINWKTVYYYNYGFLWSFDTTKVQDQTLDQFTSNFRVVGTYDLTDETRFFTDQGYAFDIEVESGDATISADNKITVNSPGDLRLHLTNIGDQLYYYDLDTVITVSITTPYQSILEDEFISNINTAGEYLIPEDYSTDQGLLSTIEAVSQNVIITEDTLLVNASGEVTLRVTNEGDNNYYAFDTTVTFEVEKLEIASYETDFFDNLKLTGNYFLPEFKAEKGAILTARFISGSGRIDGNMLKINDVGEYVVELYTEETAMVKAFSKTFTFVIPDKKLQTILKEDFVSNITTVGKYPIPSNFKSDQGYTLYIEPVSSNSSVASKTLYINASGEVKLRVYNTGDPLYHAVDTVMTFNVSKLSIDTYNTDFFDGVTATGVYTMPKFTVDDQLDLSASVVSGNAEIVGDSLMINATGTFEIMLSTPATPMYEAFSKTFTFTVSEKAAQTLVDEALISTISTVGQYTIPENYSSDQGVLLTVEAVSENATVADGTLNINASGEVQLKVSNAGNGTYLAFDSTFTFEASKLSLEAYETDFFESVTKPGTYTLPDFVTSENVVLTPSINSNNVAIEGNTLTVHNVGVYEVVLSAEATSMYEAFSQSITFRVFSKAIQTLEKEEFISVIKTVGEYKVPEHYITDQGFALNVRPVTPNAHFADSTLSIDASGEVQVRIYNTGNNDYASFDSTIVIEVSKLLMSGYETSFFDTLKVTGEYTMPKFITEEGVQLTAKIISGDGEIDRNTLSLNSIGAYEVELSSEATPMYEAYSMSVTFNVTEDNTTDPPTSLEDDLSESMKLFPNPAKNKVTLQLPVLEGEVELTLISASGQVLKVESIQGVLQHQLDISNLKTGVYILRMNSESGVGMKRLIVK